MIESVSIIFIAFSGFFLAAYLFHKKRRKHEPFICPLRANCSEVMQRNYSKFCPLTALTPSRVFPTFLSMQKYLKVQPSSTWGAASGSGPRSWPAGWVSGPRSPAWTRARRMPQPTSAASSPVAAGRASSPRISCPGCRSRTTPSTS